MPQVPPEPPPSETTKSPDAHETLAGRVVRGLTTPATLAAIVVTVFGSFAVALTTGSVTRALGERQVQFQVIDRLMTYATGDILADSLGITKLSALIELVTANEQFDIDVSGFAKIVEDFHGSTLVTKTREIAQLTEQQENLRSQLGESGSTTSALQADLASLDQELAMARETRSNAVAERDRIRQERSQATSTNLELSTSLAQLRDSLQSLTQELARFQPQERTFLLLVDSIEALHDGTAGPTDWDFVFRVEEQTAGRQYTLDDDEPARPTHETLTFVALDGETIRFSIQATEIDEEDHIALGVSEVHTRVASPLDSQKFAVPVEIGDDHDNGAFRVHVTLRRQ